MTGYAPTPAPGSMNDLVKSLSNHSNIVSELRPSMPCIDAKIDRIFDAVDQKLGQIAPGLKFTDMQSQGIQDTLRALSPSELRQVTKALREELGNAHREIRKELETSNDLTLNERRELQKLAGDIVMSRSAAITMERSLPQSVWRRVVDFGVNLGYNLFRGASNPIPDTEALLNNDFRGSPKTAEERLGFLGDTLAKLSERRSAPVMELQRGEGRTAAANGAQYTLAA
jgi:hypothetical protein